MLSANARALLHSLLRDLPGDRHILTLHTRHAMSTAVDRRGGDFEIEHPEVVERLYTAFTAQAPAAVIVRTFTARLSHSLPDGTAIPLKRVLGWRLGGGAITPVDEAEMFNAHCVDAASGEPIPPERGVEYAGAPAVEIPDLDQL